MKKRWIYDIEIYPNLFLICAKVPGTNIRKVFHVSPVADQRHEFILWLKDEVDDMVGFNNLFYDYPVLHFIINKLIKQKGRTLTAEAFKFSSRLIRSNNRFNRKVYPLRKQIDLFKINHFDNLAKSTSLKQLEFNLRMQQIQELPYAFDTVLTESQIWDVVNYCHNDTDATDLVYDETLPEIELREKLSPMYDTDFTNFNASKMGETILVKKIIEQLGESKVYNIIETPSGGTRRVPITTKRDTIHLGDVVFDYVKFTTKPFQQILKWFKSKTISETKGVFSNVSSEELAIIEGFYNTKKLKWNEIRQQFVLASTINTKGELRTLNINNFDFQYDFGVGGIHGSIRSGVYIPADDEDMEDIDVASYYPNLAIKNEFYPEHMGVEFCAIYESIYEERKKYPKKTHKMENLALKLALNGSYGKSNSEYSPLYDPMYTMKTTVNGQLLLCMLSEALMTRVPGCRMIQINTDGMTIVYKKHFKSLVSSICREWEGFTQLELESVLYSKMIIKDVNNYIAVPLDGSYIKRKGAAFIYKQAPGELELNKNFSQLIVPKALEAYFVHGTPVEEFIENHDDVYDFFKRVKIQRNHRLLEREYDEHDNIVDETEIQRLTRYIITGEVVKNKESKLFEKTGIGRTLIKEMPPLQDKILPRNNNIEAGWLCSVFNYIEDEANIRALVYHPYYIEEAYKVINMIEYKEE